MDVGANVTCVEQSQGPRHLRDRILRLSELRNLPPVEPLIKGLVYRNTLAQLSGPPGCYKSFAAIAMSCAPGTGKSFGDFVVPNAGTVLYVAAEGASGLAVRVLAWCEVWGVDVALVQRAALLFGFAASARRRTSTWRRQPRSQPSCTRIYWFWTLVPGALLAWKRIRRPSKDWPLMPQTASGPPPVARSWRPPFLAYWHGGSWLQRLGWCCLVGSADGRQRATGNHPL